MTYSVTVIRDPDALLEVLPEWRDFMASNPHGCSFYNDPEIVELAVSHDGPSPYIVLVRRAGRLECVAPFGIHSSHFGLRLSVFKLASFSVRLLKLFGEDVVYSADADVAKCCSLIFKSMNFADFDLVYFEALDTRSPLWEYCSATNGKRNGLRFARLARAKEQSFQIALPPTFPEYVATLGSSTRNSLKRRAKRLFADHSAKLVKITTPDQVEQFLDDADAIFSDSWQAKTYGIVKKNSDMDVARMKHIAQQGWLSCYLLTSDLGPLACQFGYSYGSTFYACDFAFAQRWSALGPGAVLMYMMLEDMYLGSTPRVVDLGAGDSLQKRTFRGSPRDVGDYYVLPHNRLRHVFTLQRGLSVIEAAARALLIRTGFDKVVRRVLKHKH